MLYHISSKSGLTVLKPRISTHHQSYVYATEDKVTGLLFGTQKDDFDLLIYTENHIPIVYECYPDAIQKIYQNRSCSIYEVSEEGFQHGMTSRNAEFVCPNEVKVISEIRVNNIYQTLLDEEALHHIIIHRYEKTDEYQKTINEHIMDRILTFKISQRILDTDVRFSNYYNNLVKELKREIFPMKRIIVIGCPGSGKSTFSKKLFEITNIPLFHLDNMYWNSDKTTVTRKILIEKINQVFICDKWIIDGNYSSTLEMRLKACDTVFFLDYPVDICISGVKARQGKVRSDIPWIETEEDTEFIEYIKQFEIQGRPQILDLLNKYSDRNIYHFKNREEAELFLLHLKHRNEESV